MIFNEQIGCELWRIYRCDILGKILNVTAFILVMSSVILSSVIYQAGRFYFSCVAM
jgi:hypothetical protein